MRTWRGRLVDWVIIPLWVIMPMRVKLWSFLNDDWPPEDYDEA